ncbi:hypothetical protein CWB89_10235 [Pseudoalteromonas piscicida]|uniref:Uncharacterized protein n=1 Tax=Pseudoalteromonas piscicida TaxID=43662 RepID=A0AAQ2EPI6_PSEO7|nr:MULTISPECIES: hypothetical protein [Pseudoalteromonas]KJY87701.1 hypothetical protein TW75_14205 [Pseudoalteromonas piscicida]TMN33329.1 hypothetical protein CWB95_22845 [Pseudoalteromonas piscicida]TMN39108.1 hypothetical protein CWB94_11705 [Pseudoalteromonas piscicida]TMN52383.1 hypothetical protein CWB91_11380 [Pseudoalteromonas piscicida]TMN54353.1 hypothetical protein CWB92_06885 [Pseudoalteromonas piscicida]
MEINFEQQLIDLGKQINHIEFNQYPEENYALQMLVEENEYLTFGFDFENSKRRKKSSQYNFQPITVNCYSTYINSRITAAHIETDCFIDYSDFYDFSRLERLYLYVSNPNVDCFDDRDVANLWHFLRDLASKRLKYIEFDISDLTDTAKDQINSLLKNPLNVVELNLIDALRKPPRRK